MKIRIKKRLSAVFTAMLMTITAFGSIIAEAANLICYEDLGYVSSSGGLGGEQTLISLDIGQEYYGICVHPNTSAHRGDNYVQSDADSWWNNTVTDSQKEAIGLICHYGYPNVDSKVYRAATQLLVWEIIGGKNTGPLRHYEEGEYASINKCSPSLLTYYTGKGDVTKEAVTAAYNDIVSKIVNHGTVTDVAKDTKSEALGKPIVLTSGGSSTYKTILYKQDKALWNDFGWTEALESINGVTVEEWGYNSTTGLANYTIKSTVVYDDPIATAKRTKKSTVQNKEFNGLTIFVNRSESAGQQICYGSESPSVSAYLAIQTRNDGAEFSFEKVDAETGKLIGSSSIPALFTIHRDAACATPPISSFEIRASGTATVVLNTAVMQGDGFYVREQIAVNGYKLSTKIYKAKPNTVTTIPNERITGSITINKSSEDDIIEGWKFEISYTDEEGLKTVEAVTDANGKATITDLPVYRTTDGSVIEYTVHEALTEEQLKSYKQLDVQTCKLTEGTAQFQVEMKFANERARGDIKVIKIAEDGNEYAIKGIDFYAVDENGYEFRATTDADGIAIFSDLLTGKYEVFEDSTSVSVGYITADSQTIVVVKDTVAELEVLNKTTKIEITKLSEKTGQPLAGAVMQILDANGTVVEEWTTTDTPHYIEAKLIAGATYTLHEVSAPAGYVTAPDKTFTVSKDGSIDKVDMTDLTTKVQISKQDITNSKELPGAKLQVIDSTGTVVDEWISTDTPHYIEAKLIAGATYTLHEEVPADGYVIANDIKFIVNNDGSVTSVVMKDDTTKVEITKLSEKTGQPLAGAVMQILDANGTVVEEWTTTDTAHFIEAKLIAGATYTLHEVSAPAGYVTAPDKTFTVSKDGSIDKVDMTDLTTKVQISKQDITNSKELPGAKLQVIDSTGTVVDEWISTDTPHYIEAKLIAGATYTLREEIAPAGYVIANEVIFTVSLDGSVDKVQMVDDIIKGNIEVLKVDEDYPDNKLTGAEFTVYNDVDADGKYTADIDTEYGKLIEADGTYSLTEIPYGHYLVKETKSPVDFTADDTYYPVFIQEDGKTYAVANSSFGFANTEMKGTIEVQKTTEGMVNLEGIKLTLEGTSAYGNPVYIEATTDADGIAVFENVPIGVYTITEDGSTVPYGYLTAEPTSVTVEYAEVTEVVIYNTEQSGTIEVQKTTEGMVNLEGIKLILEGTSDTGRAIRIESTTDVNGLATFENVPVGTYTITEDGESVPYGYLTAEPTSVTVEYAEVTEVVIYNTEQSGTIEVQKTTSDNNSDAISGIKFILEGTSDTGRAIYLEATTDADGIATFGDVPVGTYTITEDGKSVPYGYLTAEPTSVTVEYAKATNVTVVNELLDLGEDKPEDQPQTGDDMPSAIVAVSFAALLCAAALIRRKSERE